MTKKGQGLSEIPVISVEDFNKAPRDYFHRAFRGEMLYVDGDGRGMLIGAGSQTPMRKADLEKARKEAAEEARSANLDDFDFLPYLS